MVAVNGFFPVNISNTTKPERINVGAVVKGQAAALFWDSYRRANPATVVGTRHSVEPIFKSCISNTEVTDFDEIQRTGIVQNDVFRLDVAMHESLRMSLFEGAANLLA